MFLKVKDYEESSESSMYTWKFKEYVIINTEQITKINEEVVKAVNVTLDKVPGKRLYEIHFPSGVFYVDKEDAAKIFKVIGASL